MPRRAETIQRKSDSEIEIIGQGEIGEKARQLREKTPLLHTLGFRTPRRIVFAEDFFDTFFRSNNLGQNLRNPGAGEMESAVEHATFTQDQQKFILGKIRALGKGPLVIRSSAMADARGTGTYRSEFVENSPAAIAQGFLHVLASYFSESAVAFRKDAGAGEGFGILVEPLIGQTFDDAFIAPMLSGYGYTSTSRSEGYIMMVPGVGGGVDSRDGERIMKRDIEEVQYDLDEYLFNTRQAMMYGDKLPRQSTLLRMSRSHVFNAYEGRAFYPADGNLVDTQLLFKGQSLRVFDDLNLRGMFAMMEKLEGSVGRPQYIEWAMTAQHGRPLFWIVQIADISKRMDFFDFHDVGEILFSGHTITGSGVKECTAIFKCWNPSDVAGLREFNENNRDYILIYSSRLTTGILGDRKLQYSDFNNAAVFLEIQDAPHRDNNPLSHLDGQLDVTGKFVGVLDYDADVPPNWDTFKKGLRQEDGSEVFRGNVSVVASERQNRMVIYIQE